MLSYREKGTSHMLCPNFEQHFNSARHMKYTEIATKVTVTKGRKPLSASFRNSIKDGITPLLIKNCILDSTKSYNHLQMKLSFKLEMVLKYQLLTTTLRDARLLTSLFTTNQKTKSYFIIKFKLHKFHDRWIKCC